jgi:hypothetical protein
LIKSAGRTEGSGLRGAKRSLKASIPNWRTSGSREVEREMEIVELGFDMALVDVLGVDGCL